MLKSIYEELINVDSLYTKLELDMSFLLS